MKSNIIIKQEIRRPVTVARISIELPFAQLTFIFDSPFKVWTYYIGILQELVCTFQLHRDSLQVFPYQILSA